MTTRSNGDFLGLLIRSGAVPPRSGRGKWTCPECGRNTLSVNINIGAFKCFHAGCMFKGRVGTLLWRLGLHREWLPRQEFRWQQHQRAQADSMARRVYALWKQRWSETIDLLHGLNALEDSAHKLGPHNPRTWHALGIVYESRPQIQALLLILEVSPIQKLVQFLGLDAKGRKAIMERVVFNRGIHAGEGRFIELTIWAA